MDLATTLRWTAERHPHRIAVSGTGRTLTYAEWDAADDRLARALRAAGVATGGPGRAVDDRRRTARQPVPGRAEARRGPGAAVHPLRRRRAAATASATRGAVLVGHRRGAGRPDGRGRGGGAAAHRRRPGRRGRRRRATTRPGRRRPRTRRPSCSTPPAPPDGRRACRARTAPSTPPPSRTPCRPGSRRASAVLGVMPLFHTMGLRTLAGSIVVGGTWVAQPAFDADGDRRRWSPRERRRRRSTSSRRCTGRCCAPARLDEARALRNLAYAGAAMTPSLAEELVERGAAGVVRQPLRVAPRSTRSPIAPGRRPRSRAAPGGPGSSPGSGSSRRSRAPRRTTSSRRGSRAR